MTSSTPCYESVTDVKDHRTGKTSLQTNLTVSEFMAFTVCFVYFIPVTGLGIDVTFVAPSTSPPSMPQVTSHGGDPGRWSGGGPETLPSTGGGECLSRRARRFPKRSLVLTQSPTLSGVKTGD